MKIIKHARTFLPEILAPGTGLSPITDRSRVPTNNVPTIQDVLNGHPYRLPGGGGEWSSGRGEDSFKSYKEEGDDYKRREKDLEILKKIAPFSKRPSEVWKIKVPGGSKTFTSFENAQAFKRQMDQKGIPVKWMARTKTAQNNKTDTMPRSQVVTEALLKTVMVESIDVQVGIREIGSAFCVDNNYFVTCAHVVHRYNKNIQRSIDLRAVTSDINIIQNGKKYKAEIIAIDGKLDIALLKADINVEPLLLDTHPDIAAEVLTVGSPHGFENNVSFGNIGSTNRKIYHYEGAPEYLFIDSAVFSGNSGGPAINVKNGGVIAMMTAIVTSSGEYGLNAGLPSSYIEEFCKTNNVNIHEVV